MACVKGLLGGVCSSIKQTPIKRRGRAYSMSNEGNQNRLNNNFEERSLGKHRLLKSYAPALPLLQPM